MMKCELTWETTCAIMFAYKPQSGTTINSTVYKSKVKKAKSGFLIRMRKAAREITRTKISTMDHFASASSQRKIEPRRPTETTDGGKNHKANVISCLVYGQMPEKIRIMIANSLAPAFHISIADFAIENSKKFLIDVLSPATCTSTFTLAPLLRWPLRNSAILPKIIKGITKRMTSGTSLLKIIAFVDLLSDCSSSFSRSCSKRRLNVSFLERVFNQFACLCLATQLMANMITMMSNNEHPRTIPTATMKLFDSPLKTTASFNELILETEKSEP
mmetsp:Transcript_37525/g.55239  ORF Transcript_37525/g.55239 Transcript_37525/m.55239 type:complete len:274 (+) Transcript_37525:1487-2308(+)